MDSPLGLHSHVKQILAEFRFINSKFQKQDEAIKGLEESNRQLTAKVQMMEVEIQDFKQAKKGRAVIGSNNHPDLKPFVHPMFSDLCGVERTMSKSKCTNALANLSRLENGEPYEILENGKKVWRLYWLGTVDDNINAKFIQEVADRVHKNEELYRKNVSVKGQIPDKDFSLELIVQMAKIYFRTIHKKAMTFIDDEAMDKAAKRAVATRRWGRHAASTKARRKAAKEYGKDIQCEHVEALVDTDWCSEQLSYDEDNLSDDSKNRRMNAGVGDAANMAVGYTWRSLDYVAFLRFLSLHALKGPDLNADDPAESESGPSEPPKKRAKTRPNKKLVKTTFDVTPEQMIDQAPSNKKKKPFRYMVDPMWLEEHPEMKVLGGMEWLDGFYGRLKDSELLKGDSAYLKELHEWHLT